MLTTNIKINATTKEELEMTLDEVKRVILAGYTAASDQREDGITNYSYSIDGLESKFMECPHCGDTNYYEDEKPEVCINCNKVMSPPLRIAITHPYCEEIDSGLFTANFLYNDYLACSIEHTDEMGGNDNMVIHDKTLVLNILREIMGDTKYDDFIEYQLIGGQYHISYKDTDEKAAVISMDDGYSLEIIDENTLTTLFLRIADDYQTNVYFPLIHEVQIIGMVSDPEDDNSIVNANSVDMEPTTWDVLIRFSNLLSEGFDDFSFNLKDDAQTFADFIATAAELSEVEEI
jgi:hypothetical protein